MSIRMADCSSKSPDFELREDAPIWCGAFMYDPEGLLSSFPVVMSTWIGLYAGHVIKYNGLE